MCHKDFPIKEAYYIKDTKSFKIENKSDAFKINSYTSYLDQMILYAALRKGRGEIKSKKLNDVGMIEIGDEKLDYSEDANIKTLPYVDYRKFVAYNIKDVLLQYGIAKKTGDIENLYIRTLMNATPFEKAFKQTVFLKNRSYLSLFQQGFIIGNNVLNVEENEETFKQHAVFEDDDDDDGDIVEDDGKTDTSKKDDDKKFEGALVGDPTLNYNAGIMMYGKPSNRVFDLVGDADYSSMYPNEIITFNKSAATMIGKAFIPSVNFDNIPIYYKEHYTEKEIKRFDPGKEFIEHYLSNNITVFGNIWFNLPSTEELIDEFAEFMED